MARNVTRRIMRENGVTEPPRILCAIATDGEKNEPNPIANLRSKRKRTPVACSQMRRQTPPRQPPGRRRYFPATRLRRRAVSLREKTTAQDAPLLCPHCGGRRRLAPRRLRLRRCWWHGRRRARGYVLRAGRRGPGAQLRGAGLLSSQVG